MSVVQGMTQQQVEDCLGQPNSRIQTNKRKLWVYYYDKIEIYFDEAGVVEWTYEIKEG
jgi:outer membrane protein assembly factor BamE (lipoprotein component of BamABCDE complex)